MRPAPSRAGRPAAALAALLLLLAPASAQDPPAGPRDLRPRYAEGDRLEAESRLSLVLDVRLVVPSARIDYTSQQEQLVLRRHRDQVVRVQDGRPTEVRRAYQDAWSGTRQPGAPDLDLEPEPMHQRRVIVALDDRGRRVVRTPPEDPPLPEGALDDVLLSERYEAVLPAAPVAPGAEWTIEGEALATVLGPQLGDSPAGRIRCAFEGVRELTLDAEEWARLRPGEPPPPPEPYAVVALDVEASGRQGLEEDAPTMSVRMTGKLFFSLRAARIARLELAGTARLRQTRREGDVVAEVDGSGPVEILKRAWFPARPRRR